MGRQGIFDAFQAAAGATQTVLDDLDKQNRLKAEMEVQDAALKDKEAFNQFLLDVQNSNDWENYEQRWDDFKVKVHNDTSKGLSSPFARRVYDAQYKNAEMDQRLLVKKIANEKMRMQDFTKGHDYIGNVITSNSFADTEEVGEDGNTYTKTVSQQKKELIDKKLFAMYEAGLLDYDQFNQSMRDSYARLMMHDMVTAGKKLVDGGASIEDVVSATQEYKGEYATIAGGSVTADAVREAAAEKIESYFYKQQAIRYKNGEQGASRVYRQMSDALANGNWDEAYKKAEEGRNFLKAHDAKYRGNGFDANVRDEYADKFMLKDDVKIAGEYGGLAKMKPEEEVNVWLYWMKKGRPDKNGELLRLTHSEVINILTGEALQSKKKLLGEEAAMAKTYEVLAKLDEEICKPPFCNVGVAASIKGIEGAVRQVLDKDKNFNTPEGQGYFLRVLGETKAQGYDYLSNTPFDKQKPEDVEKLVVGILLSQNLQIKEHLFGNEKKQAVKAGAIQANIAARERTGVYGEDLSNTDIERQEAQLRNYAIENVRKATGLGTQEAVLGAFNIDQLDDGKVVFYDKKTKKPVYAQDRDESGASRLYNVFEEENGTLKLIPQDKTPDQRAREIRVEELKDRGFNRNADTIGVENTGTDKITKKVEGSEEYRQYVEKIEKPDRPLFKSVRDSYAAADDFKNGSVSVQAQEVRVKEEFERSKKTLSEFNKTGKSRVPADIKADFFSFYNLLKDDYQKVTLIDAYEAARQKPVKGRVSLAVTIDEFVRLKNERGLKTFDPRTKPFYTRAKSADKK